MVLAMRGPSLRTKCSHLASLGKCNKDEEQRKKKHFVYTEYIQNYNFPFLYAISVLTNVIEIS